jgi:hypothetical protein
MWELLPWLESAPATIAVECEETIVEGAPPWGSVAGFAERRVRPSRDSSLGV